MEVVEGDWGDGRAEEVVIRRRRDMNSGESILDRFCILFDLDIGI